MRAVTERNGTGKPGMVLRAVRAAELANRRAEDLHERVKRLEAAEAKARDVAGQVTRLWNQFWKDRNEGGIHYNLLIKVAVLESTLERQLLGARNLSNDPEAEFFLQRLANERQEAERDAERRAQLELVEEQPA